MNPSQEGADETTTSGVVPDISGGSVMGGNRAMNTGPGVSCPICGKKCKRGKCPKHGQMYEAVLAKDIRARGKVYKKGLKVKPLLKTASGKYNVMLEPGITTVVRGDELTMESTKEVTAEDVAKIDKVDMAKVKKKYPAYAHVEDLSHGRGQGKRVGKMVMGGMATIGLKARIPDYAKQFKVSGEDLAEIKSMSGDNDGPMLLIHYAKARYAGYSHGKSMAYAWMKQDHESPQNIADTMNKNESLDEARIRAGKDNGEYVVMLVATNDTYYWTGKEWTTKRTSAEVYKDMRSAAKAIQTAKVKGKQQTTVEGE